MVSVLAMSLGLTETPANRAIPAAGVLTTQRRDIATRFGPGNNVNPSGRPKVAYFRKALLKQLLMEVANGVTRLDLVCDGLINMAIEGDVAAMVCIRDTIGEKPVSDTAVNNQIRIGIGVEFIANEAK
jgi:hypothetical protein